MFNFKKLPVRLAVNRYPRISRSEFSNWNEKMFIRYNNDRVYNHVNPLIRFIEKRRVNAVLDLLKPVHPFEKVLAAGCGEGYIESRILLCKLYLVDLSREAIKRAKQTLGNSKRLNYKVANLEKLPFAKDFFDKIECSEVVEHVFSPKNMVSELTRVLKPGGILVITFPNEPLINFFKKILISLGLFYRFFPNLPRDMTEEWHLHSFNLRFFGRILEKKLRVKIIKGIPFNWLSIRYVVKCEKKGASQSSTN